MKVDNLIGWLKDRRVIVSIITMVIVCGGYYLVKRSETKSLRLLKDTFIVEYGKPILTDCKEYLDMTTMKTTNKEDVYTKAKFSINKNNQKEYPDIGKYVATIVYKQEHVSFPIIVQDTTPPKFAPIEDIVMEVGIVLTSEQLRDKFVVTDLQGVKVEVDKGSYDGITLGEYTIKATAKDDSGNMASSSYCITVEKNKSNSSEQEDKEVISGGEQSTKKTSVDKNFPEAQVDWWANLSNQEIKDKVISSLVWQNEWTKELYYGIHGLTYGFNVANQAYGGLILLENPYNVQIDFGFYGGPYCQTDVDTFFLYWQAPRGPGKEVDCGKMKVNIPKAIMGEELYTHYQ